MVDIDIQRKALSTYAGEPRIVINTEVIPIICVLYKTTILPPGGKNGMRMILSTWLLISLHLGLCSLFLCIIVNQTETTRMHISICRDPLLPPQFMHLWPMWSRGLSTRLEGS